MVTRNKITHHTPWDKLPMNDLDHTDHTDHTHHSDHSDHTDHTDHTDNTDHTDHTDPTIGVQHLPYNTYCKMTHPLERISETVFSKTRGGGTHSTRKKNVGFGKISSRSFRRRIARRLQSSSKIVLGGMLLSHVLYTKLHDFRNIHKNEITLTLPSPGSMNDFRYSLLSGILMSDQR